MLLTENEIIRRSWRQIYRLSIKLGHNKILTVWGWGTVHLPRPFEDVSPLLENWLKWHWFQLLCRLHGFLPFQLYFQDLPIMRNEKTILGIFSIKKENFQFYFQHWPTMRNENNNLMDYVRHGKIQGQWALNNTKELPCISSCLTLSIPFQHTKSVFLSVWINKTAHLIIIGHFLPLLILRLCKTHITRNSKNANFHTYLRKNRICKWKPH